MGKHPATVFQTEKVGAMQLLGSFLSLWRIWTPNTNPWQGYNLQVMSAIPRSSTVVTGLLKNMTHGTAQDLYGDD